MKRAIFLTMLALSLTLGTSGAFAWPPDPCNRTHGHRAARTLSGEQLLLLLLPTFVTPIA